MMICTKVLSTKQSVVLLIAVCSTFIVMFGDRARAEGTPLRVAVIDTGDKPSAPPALLDLLVVQLSQQESLVVLERQEIAAVLSEQGRNLTFAEKESQDSFVAAGRILGADALVLISADSPNDQGLQPIEARIIETRRGVRFGNTVLAWSEDEQAIAQQIQSATEQMVNRLRRIQNTKGKFTVVSLAGFRTDELSQEAHRFRRSIELWLESWLASQPGIAVAERTKVLPLIDERKLTSDLPTALGNADVTIDGTFKLNFNEQHPQVELTIRVIRKDRSVATHSLRAPIGNQANLRKSAGKAVLELLAVTSVDGLFDAEAEARLLTDEAERLLTFGRRYEALKRLTTAYALEPDNFRIQALLLHAGLWLGGLDPSGASFDGSFYPTALFVSDVARQILDKIEQGVQLPSDLSFYETDTLIQTTIDFCRLIRKCSEYGVPEHEATQHDWFRVAISDLYHHCLKITQKSGGRLYENSLWHGMSIGFYWAKTPEEALAERRNLIERADDLEDVSVMGESVLMNDFQFRLDRNLAWADRKDLQALLKTHYEGMVTSSRIILQARGEKGLAQYAFRELDDKELAMKHYRRFIDLIVNELIPNYPKITYDIGGFWLQEPTYVQDKISLTHEEAGELWSRVIRARWSRGCPRSSQVWEYRIKPTVFHLEKAGQVRQADVLLQDCLDWLKEAPKGLSQSKVSSQWKKTSARLLIVQEELRVRHPDLRKQQDVPADLAVKCQSCLTIRQLLPELEKADLFHKRHLQSLHASSQHIRHMTKFMLDRLWKLSGIVSTKDGYVVLCSGEEIYRAGVSEENTRRQRLVVIQLNSRGNR